MVGYHNFKLINKTTDNFFKVSVVNSRFEYLFIFRFSINIIYGWNERISGTHAFNPGTGNDVFFADKGFKFHTGMNLNDGQRIDLEDNNNIL